MSCGGMRRSPIEGKCNSVEGRPGHHINPSFFVYFLVGECLRAGGAAFFWNVGARRWEEVDRGNASVMSRSEAEDRMVRECLRLPVAAVEVMPAVEESVGKLNL